MIDEALGGNFKEFADVHASKAFQLLQLAPNISLGLPNKSRIDHSLVFSCFWVKRGIEAECLTKPLIELA